MRHFLPPARSFPGTVGVCPAPRISPAVARPSQMTSHPSWLAGHGRTGGSRTAFWRMIALRPDSRVWVELRKS